MLCSQCTFHGIDPLFPLRAILTPEKLFVLLGCVKLSVVWRGNHGRHSLCFWWASLLSFSARLETRHLMYRQPNRNHQPPPRQNLLLMMKTKTKKSSVTTPSQLYKYFWQIFGWRRRFLSDFLLILVAYLHMLQRQFHLFLLSPHTFPIPVVISQKRHFLVIMMNKNSTGQHKNVLAQVSRPNPWKWSSPGSRPNSWPILRPLACVYVIWRQSITVDEWASASHFVDTQSWVLATHHHEVTIDLVHSFPAQRHYHQNRPLNQRTAANCRRGKWHTCSPLPGCRFWSLPPTRPPLTLIIPAWNKR